MYIRNVNGHKLFEVDGYKFELYNLKIIIDGSNSNKVAALVMDIYADTLSIPTNNGFMSKSFLSFINKNCKIIAENYDDNNIHKKLIYYGVIRWLNDINFYDDIYRVKLIIDNLMCTENNFEIQKNLKYTQHKNINIYMAKK
jgi:hypothetical protein